VGVLEHGFSLSGALRNRLSPTQASGSETASFSANVFESTESGQTVIGMVAQADLALKDKPECVHKAEISKTTRP
jgi:hypothetical protein